MHLAYYTESYHIYMRKITYFVAAILSCCVKLIRDKATDEDPPFIVRI